MAKESAVVAILDTHQQAEDTVKRLQGAGFDMKKMSIVGKGYRSEEQPIGFYTTGDRVRFWGGTGALWGGVWGLLFGAALFWIPGIGPVAVGGQLVAMVVSGLEGAAVVGGLSALGAALYGLGVPKDSIVRYETALKADKYLVIANGDAAELEKARTIMGRISATDDAVRTA